MFKFLNTMKYCTRYEEVPMEQVFLELFQEIISPTSVRLKGFVQEYLQWLSLAEPTSIFNEICPVVVMLAIVRGKIDILQYFITNFCVNIEEKSRYVSPMDESVHIVTPLWAAVASMRTDMVRYLIQEGAEVNTTSDTGVTPLYVACYCNSSSYEIAKLLIASGAEVNAKNASTGISCLINSVGDVHLCRLLLREKAAVDAVDKNGRTALHYASKFQLIETTKLLLEFGANVNSVDFQLKTPLYFAIEEQSSEIVKILLENRAENIFKIADCPDALRFAALVASEEIFECVLAAFHYEPQRIFDEYKLLGASILLQHFDVEAALRCWETSIQLSLQTDIQNVGANRRVEAGALLEFRSAAELETLREDSAALCTQAVLISERLSGVDSTWAATSRYQFGHFCLQNGLSQLGIEFNLRTLSIDHRTEMGLTPEDIYQLGGYFEEAFRIMKYIELTDPSFEDVYTVFMFLIKNIENWTVLCDPILQRTNRENWDKILIIIVKLLFVMVPLKKTVVQNDILEKKLKHLLSLNLRTRESRNSVLHLAIMETGDEAKLENYQEQDKCGVGAVRLVLRCGAEVNDMNYLRKTPLLVATSLPLRSRPDYTIMKLLLDEGAHMDLPDRSGVTPYDRLRRDGRLNLIKYDCLECMAARVLIQHGLPYSPSLPPHLINFVHLHNPLV